MTRRTGASQVGMQRQRDDIGQRMRRISTNKMRINKWVAMSNSNTTAKIMCRLSLLLLLLFWSNTDLAAAWSTRPRTMIRTHELHMADSSSPPSTFPLARKRNALIEKAKWIDPALAKGESKGSYAGVGWSNRLGAVLTPAAIPGVYTADRPFYWNRIDVACRMTVIELEDDTLWVHSPVRLDEPLKQALAKLGKPVRHVVSPNYEHVTFAKEWAVAYPDANMWACPGLSQRETDTRWTGEIPHGMRPPSWTTNHRPNTNHADELSSSANELPQGFWDCQQIQPLHLDFDVNPFTGTPFFNEVIFYHAPSSTLMATDSFWNYPRSDGLVNGNFADATHNSEEEDFGIWELAPDIGKVPFTSVLWKFGMDKIFKPFYMNLMVKQDKRNDFLKIASFICGDDCGEWDIETVIPAHGDIIRGKTMAKEILRQHFNLPTPKL